MDSNRAETYPLRRRQVVASLLADRGEMLVVAGLGAPAWDATAAGDHALTFPLWGAMGGAAMIGLGLALARPERRVLVITGDGEMLMGLGSLATIAVQAPANLAIAVLDNEHYGETGMQATHTAHDVDMAGMAAAAGLPVTGTVESEAGLKAAIVALRGAGGPVFYTIKVRAEDLPLALPPRDGVELKGRFRAALLGKTA
ncbi:MAG: thiamine pyrophosphate-dependent enzyme [Rhodospirillales bacterium]|nr:thiamine pyrophosphate-dependent enzyme [Rhodospirillales bacterium]HJO71269.1 thiamine pyrophosphate-dependent enzyme [Rhodospirillales bacterium]